jgi:hypothetical protein
VEGVFAPGDSRVSEDGETGGIKLDKAVFEVRIRQLCSTVGPSAKLFAYVCDWLAAKIVGSGDAALSPQLRVFLLTLEETGHKVGRVDAFLRYYERV